ncbi:GTP-binding protein [Streptomyces zhihengii]
MRVVATAGHVDHGKSTLIHALTGTHPDRLAEERRRGLTIDLGFAWTDLPSGNGWRSSTYRDTRFVPTMLAGVGPVPAVLFVVAADEGWKPQSAEHLAALDALGVRHGLLVVTRRDVADPGPATAEARERIRSSTLGDVEAVAVSARTGRGLDGLRAALDRLVARLPDGNAASPVRLWIDRSFTVRGSGLVVTGTLGAGRISRGDILTTARSGRPVRVRGSRPSARRRPRCGPRPASPSTSGASTRSPPAAATPCSHPTASSPARAATRVCTARRPPRNCPAPPSSTSARRPCPYGSGRSVRTPSG